MLHPGNRDGPTQPHRRPGLQETPTQSRYETPRTVSPSGTDERVSTSERAAELVAALLARSLQRRRALPERPPLCRRCPPAGPATACIGHATRAPYPTNAPSLAAAANRVSHAFL